MWEGVVAGSAVGLVNGVVAWILLRWSADRDMLAFLKAVLGGMVGRLLFVAIASLLIIKLTAVDRVAYAVALLAVYLVSLLVEVLVIVGRTRSDK